MKLILYGNPATKKNNMQIFKNHKTGQRYLSQSDRYKDYARDCGRQITGKYKKNIDYPINLKCVYYRKTKHRVDLNNLLSATSDILTDYGVIADDNFKIMKSVDGSRVLFDKNNPRVEIEIERFEEKRKRFEGLTLDELKMELSEIDERVNIKLYTDGWMDIDFRINERLILIASIEVNSEKCIEIHSNREIEPETYFKIINSFMKFANTKPEDRGIDND